MKKPGFSAAAIAAVIAVAAATAAAAEPLRQPVLLGGKPFPRVERYVPEAVTARRTFFVAEGKEAGDGSETRPWTDLQQALRALQPGDRLRVAKGTYRGSLAVDGRCRDGTREHPIQLLFARDAVIVPAEGQPAIAIRRSHWRISGPLLRLGESAATGIDVAGSSVSIDAAQISGGTANGIRIGRDATAVTISNCILSKRNIARPTAAGVEIEGGAAEVVLTHNRFHVHRGGSIRIGAPGSRPARNVRLTANTIRDDGATAILAARAAGLHIADNTLFAAPGSPGTRGIDLRAVDGAVVRSNQLTGFALGISAGRVDPVVHAAREVTVDRNHIETAAADGIGVAFEAGQTIRFVNNALNGYADAILVLGRRPALSGVSIANNLILGVSRTAFVVRDPAAAELFDFNVFSPAHDRVEVEMSGRPSPLRAYVERAMPNSRTARVVMFDHDLARLGGIDTVDRGVAIAGLPFDGKSPDLGVAER